MSIAPEFLCALCSKLIDLNIDLNADETGRTVHEKSYVNKIRGVEKFVGCAACEWVLPHSASRPKKEQQRQYPKPSGDTIAANPRVGTLSGARTTKVRVNYMPSK
jgi:hypothetical protein